MKVLIISQPVLSQSNNMGKTLAGYFKAFSPKDISQLYLRQGVPTSVDTCENYYCFSDSDALKSILNHKVQGVSYTGKSLVCTNNTKSTLENNDAYKLGSAHKAWMLFARDAVWKLSTWKNKKLLNWLDHTEADVVFFAPGDGAFIYRVADEIARYLHKSLVMVCMDDFFVNNRTQNEVLGKLRQKCFMKVVHKTVKNCDAIFTICDEMNKAYSSLFNKKCFTLHTPADNKEVVLNPNARHVSYIGNLSCGRYRTLLDLGKAISEISDDSLPKYIDVYSGSKENEYIEPLKNAQGICFHGAIPAEQVPGVMSESMMVIHTESFDPVMMELVHFSVSTKIAESLMYGPCLLAYGPEGIASIDYLKENNAAYVITDQGCLAEKMKEILLNAELREQIMKNARALAALNHNADINPKKLRNLLESFVEQAAN